MSFFLREAWHEFRVGLKGGVLPLVYVLLTGYIMMVMTHAESLRSMGAVDVPRNAPALVYLMASGMAFFLFFAWAWVFAQPIVRDRNAQLHELVLAAPLSLRSLLAARYLGALGVALVLGTSQILGFLCAPLLQAIGAVPPGSVAAAPWLAFGWGFVVFTLPLAAGAGALYFAAAMKSRSVGAAFAVAAGLMAFWMVAMIVFKEGHADAFLYAVIDPSGFAETERQVVNHWTPLQKRTALIELTPALILNRLIWGVAPLALLTLVVLRASREGLLHGKGEPKSRNGRLPRTGHAAIAVLAMPAGPAAAPAWLRAAGAEALWQMRQFASRRSLWIAFALLVVLAVAAGFVHGIQHAWGPMKATPEFITPVLTRTFYLIVVFMVAAMVGLAARRDEQRGLVEMFDAAPAPGGVRLAGRVAAALAVSVFCVCVPAAGAIVVGLLTTGQGVSLLPLAHELTVFLPSTLELAAIVLLLHALIRHPGTAHAASIMAAFIMVVNFEVQLVNYPPYQFGRPNVITLSQLTGFAPWAEKLLASSALKLAVAGVLVALAAVVTRRGTDEGVRPRLGQWRRNLLGQPGLAMAAGIVAVAACLPWLHQRFVTEGGFKTHEEELAGNAAWEKRWLPRQGAFTVDGGDVAIEVRPADRALVGQWRMEGVRVAAGELHAVLPNGFELQGVKVDGQAVAATVDDEHLAIPVAGCRDKACTVEIGWRLSAQGWIVAEHDAQTPPAWLVGDAFWLRASEVMPRLGLDAGRVVRAPAERARYGLPPQVALPVWAGSLSQSAAAPFGRWRWTVTVADQPAVVQTGVAEGLLDFAVLHAPQARQTRVGGITLVHDSRRDADAALVAEDLAAMRNCVVRRLGQAPEVTAVAQWPRGLPTGSGDAAVAGPLLLLAEEPHWDVAAKGTGRWARRADIATALAQRVVLDAADLREGKGHLWIGDGLPGAVGMLCVAEVDGADALLALLSRGGQRTTEALADAHTPVGPLALATRGEWARDYAPLAALNWASRLESAEVAALLAAVKARGDVAAALAVARGAGGAGGADAVARMLGAPNSVDLQVRDGRVSGERWQWREGGWQPTAQALAPRRLQSEAGQLRWTSEAPAADRPGVYLDDWPAYEREPKDNNASENRGR